MPERVIASITTRESAITANEFYDFDGIYVSFASNSVDLLEALRGMLRSSSLPNVGQPRGLECVAHCELEWDLNVDGERFATLPLCSPAPLVAERLIAAACAAVSVRNHSFVIHGAVFEKDGRGLALFGDDFDAVKSLAFHLHARRWAAVSFEHSFLQPHTLDITGLQKLVSLNSRSIELIPNSYRRAVEASRWYDAGPHLTFYAIDPYVVHATHSLSVTLSCAILLQPASATGPSVATDVSLDAFDFGPLAAHPLASAVRTAALSPTNPIASCDAIEHWFAANAT